MNQADASDYRKGEATLRKRTIGGRQAAECDSLFFIGSFAGLGHFSVATGVDRFHFSHD